MRVLLSMQLLFNTCRALLTFPPNKKRWELGCYVELCERDFVRTTKSWCKTRGDGLVVLNPVSWFIYSFFAYKIILGPLSTKVDLVLLYRESNLPSTLIADVCSISMTFTGSKAGCQIFILCRECNWGWTSVQKFTKHDVRPTTMSPPLTNCVNPRDT